MATTNTMYVQAFTCKCTKVYAHTVHKEYRPTEKEEKNEQQQDTKKQKEKDQGIP